LTFLPDCGTFLVSLTGPAAFTELCCVPRINAFGNVAVMDPSMLFRVLRPPAHAEELATLVSASGGKLPGSYLRFLGQANGVEWCVNDEGGDCLALWRVNEIVELNEAYAIPKYVPELLAIGSNGGDDAIGFDRSESEDPEEWPVVQIEFGNLERADFVRLATGFRDWQAQGFRLRAHHRR